MRTCAVQTPLDQMPNQNNRPDLVSLSVYTHEGEQDNQQCYSTRRGEMIVI